MSDTTDARERARRLLRTERTCTLATASADGVPEAATVRFVTDNELNVHVTTESPYRKYANMTENPRVAVVVDGDDNLQLEGVAREVFGAAADRIGEKYVDKYGHSAYLDNDESVFFEIETDWARLLVDGSFPPTHEMVLGTGETDPHGSRSD
ncbi:MAG: putative flavin-nucleotide-binding protein [halophilic archaeon J07HB67]|nr:MAG: putative flavin-nucleotide-binding protein [halophilic archaeon J07HB67]